MEHKQKQDAQKLKQQDELCMMLEELKQMHQKQKRHFKISYKVFMKYKLNTGPCVQQEESYVCSITI